MGGAVIPPCSLAWDGPVLESCILYRRTIVSVLDLLATSSKRTYVNTLHLPGMCLPVPLIPQQASINPFFCLRLPYIHMQVWVSLFWGHCFFLLGPGSHRSLFMPSNSLCFPSPMEILKSNPSGLQILVPWGFLVPLLEPQVGKCVVGPRIFANVQELLWYNYSPVCGSAAQRVYDGTNDNLLQEDFCHSHASP